MMMNKAGAKPSLLCVLLQPTTTYINREIIIIVLRRSGNIETQKLIQIKED